MRGRVLDVERRLLGGVGERVLVDECEREVGAGVPHVRGDDRPRGLRADGGAAARGGGAAGFVLKDAPGEEIIQAVRAVAAGKGWLDPAITPHVLDAYRSTVRPRPAPPGALSIRERQVLALIGAGATNPEIAARLGIAEGTVKTHVGSIFTKLALRDRAAAVIYALRHGLTSEDGPP